MSKNDWKINKLEDWQITLEDFETKVFGSAAGGVNEKASGPYFITRFKVPASVIKTFRVNVYSADGVTLQGTEFDKDGFFLEIATTIVNAIATEYDILQQVSLRNLKEEDQELVRLAVYSGIEFALKNKQIWENVNGTRISLGNVSIAQDRVNWGLSESMYGKKANNYLMLARLYDYELMTEDQYHQQSAGGNVLVLGKIDIEKLPELIA